MGLSRNEKTVLTLLNEKEQNVIKASTRFHILVFLAQNNGLENGPLPESIPDQFTFRSHCNRPYSDQLESTLSGLEDRQLAQKNVQTTRRHHRDDWIITDKGAEHITDTPLPNHQQKVLWSVKALYNDTPIYKLLQTLHSQYPKFHPQSE